MVKATRAKDVRTFQNIPNVGPRIERDFLTLGFTDPQELKGRDPYILYKDLCQKTKTKHDPCVLDTFIAVVDFMNGAQAKPWYEYTTYRKKTYIL